MKRLPLNAREDADVLRTGVFPDANEPERTHVPVKCETCRFWIRKKWPTKYVKQWGQAHEGECVCPANEWKVDYGDQPAKVITGVNYSCKHWNP